MYIYQLIFFPDVPLPTGNIYILLWDCGFALLLAYIIIAVACTIGFGDCAPASQLGRFYAIFSIPLAVGATGYLLGQIADAIISRQQTKSTEKFINRKHTVEDLCAMDLDGDGQVTWAELLEFMLFTMDKVDKKLMDKLRANFDAMDLDHNGAVTKEDLVIRARQMLMKPSKKLALQAYKRQLQLQRISTHERLCDT